MNLKLLIRFNLKLLIRFTYLALAILLMSCKGKSDIPGGPGANQPPAKFSVLTLSPYDVITHLDFPATVQGQQVVEIRPKVDGFIENIYVNEGAMVKQGQLLFRISNPQYEEALRTAEASIKIAEADVQVAQMNVNKVIPLVEKDIVSKFELQSAEFNLQSKQAILAQSQASLANARTNLGYTFIKSPATGVIGNIPYKTGALVNSNMAEPLTTISDISYAHVYFSITEKQLLDFTHSFPGSNLQQILDRMMKPELVLSDGSEYSETGKLETASGLISTQTGTVGLKAVFPNPKGILRTGASAIIRLPQQVDSALLVPQSATFEVLNKRFLYKLFGNNKVISVPIGSLPTDNGQFFIVSDPLKPGDQIVLSGLSRLKDSLQIIPVKVNVDSFYSQNLGNTQLMK
jgi:membrane fusion protein, multidrug efflux system